MAGPTCMSNDGRPAVFVGTFLQNGDTVALCEDCLPQFLTAVLAQMTGVEIGRLAAEIARLSDGAPEDPAAVAAEMAAPPHQVSHGAPGDEPPAAAPADTDDQAGGAHANYPTTRRTTSKNGSGQRTGTDGPANESPPNKTSPEAAAAE